MDGKLIVATDGSPGAAGALHLAHSLARRGMEPPVVLAVQEPVPLYDVATPAAMAEAQLALERTASGQLRASVEEQLREIGAETRDWEVKVEVGSPAAAIADAARARGSAMIVLGLGRHAAVDRWLGGETALRVMQLAHVPVLAAHPDARALPRRALVAEDFSELSRDAGNRALDLLEPGGELHLAHVVRVPPAIESQYLDSDWIDSYLEGVRVRLEARREELAVAGGGPVHAHTLQGEPAPELLRLADRIGVDLVAAGRHGRGFLGRLLMGSVSTRLVRGARCSVLVVPPRP
jgi:nucleotide-binding universal stress UspA family protein